MQINIKKEKLLVNLVTLLRIPLTVIGIFGLYQYSQSADNLWKIIFILISICIYISDFIDGRLARQWKVTSDKGARLDLFCDSFYIISCLITMIWLKLSSPWILVIVFYKLFEFILLSKIKRKFFKGETLYFYDKLGRVLSVLFYLTPAMLLILHTKAQLYWDNILARYTVILIGLTIISSLVKFRKISIYIMQ